MTPEWHDRWDEGAVIAYQDLGITDAKADCCAVLGIEDPKEASAEALGFWVYDCWLRRRKCVNTRESEPLGTMDTVP